MKREFKFEVGQYVKVASTILEINKDLSKYPAKSTIGSLTERKILTSSAMITKTKDHFLREI